jgi:hypothetical protein
MRTLSAILLYLVTVFVALCAERSANTTNALCFFIVSDKPITEGRYIDTPEFPKLGYISNAPSLVVTQLSIVIPDTTALTDSGYGDNLQAPESSLPSVIVGLFPKDNARFLELSRQSVGARMLVTIGDKFLSAKLVRSANTNGWGNSHNIPIGRHNDARKIADAFKSLVPRE